VQTPRTTTPKEERVIEAATGVFLRYGHARTTMGDIAEAAGISRPALYLVFPGKGDIFAAVIGRLIADTLREFREALPALPRLEQKLHFCCEKWGAHGYELTLARPDAKDLFDLSFAPVQQMYADFEAFLAEILAAPVAASALKATPEELAHVLAFAMRGFKETARDWPHMRRMIALQVDLVAAALKSPSGASDS